MGCDTDLVPVFFSRPKRHAERAEVVAVVAVDGAVEVVAAG